jgi:hypothetical protein
MSTFRDLMGIQPHYEGVEGIRRFLRDWTEPFDEWRIEVEEFHDNFMKQGFPPIKIVRKALLGDDTPTL